MQRPILSLSPEAESRWKEKQSARAEEIRKRKDKRSRIENLRRLQERTAAEKKSDGGNHAATADLAE